MSNKLIILFFSVLYSLGSFAKNDSMSMVIYVDMPISKDKKIKQYITVIRNDTIANLDIKYQITLLYPSGEKPFEQSGILELENGKTLYDLEWKSSGFKSLGWYELFNKFEVFPNSDSLQIVFLLMEEGDTISVTRSYAGFQSQRLQELVETSSRAFEAQKQSKPFLTSYDKFIKQFYKKRGL